MNKEREALIKNVLIIVLIFLIILLAESVVRLENIRYASAVGLCQEYEQGYEKQKCLNQSETRTNFLWHIYYALIERHGDY